MIAAGPGRPGTYAEGEAEPAPVKPPLIPAVPAPALPHPHPARRRLSVRGHPPFFRFFLDPSGPKE